ncbi:MAG: dephospho-CoA kinase [Chloroflexota bacterium]
MKVIGLTGNIGCGKSTIAGWLSEMGVAVLDLDAVARQIRNNDAEARRRIEARFGTVEAGKLASVVFGNPAALQDLEAILHPLVRNETRARLAELEAAGVEAACIEAIKLLESPLHDRCDSIWVVRCEEADAVRRVATSRAMSADEAQARLANQSPQEAKIAAADVVIDGSAPMEETRRQVEAAYAAVLANP